MPARGWFSREDVETKVNLRYGAEALRFSSSRLLSIMLLSSDAMASLASLSMKSLEAHDEIQIKMDIDAVKAPDGD